MDLPQPRKFVLVVQTPDREGEGCEFLVYHTDTAKHDPRIWKDGKSDRVILALHTIAKTSLLRQASVESGTFARAIRKEFGITVMIRQVKLDFCLPSKQEVSRAHARWNRVVVVEKTKQIEERILGNQRYRAAVQAKLDGYIAFLTQPNILSGIRLHFERSLIADCKRDLQDAEMELRSFHRELKALHARQARLEAKDTLAKTS